VGFAGNFGRCWPKESKYDHLMISTLVKLLTVNLGLN
jgi:hypothetical protein